MAQRRMFSKDVANSDEFLDMPLSTQALYFHLGINADDDGFVQPKSIMRMVQAKDDDLRLLQAKGFVILFENSVIVITHWKINNEIRKDRKKDTIYKEHLAFLGLDESNIYTCQPNVNQMTTKCPRSIGKDSIGKDSIGEDSSCDLEKNLKEVESYWNSLDKPTDRAEANGYKNTNAKKLLSRCRKITPEVEEAFGKIIKKGYTVEDINEAIKKYALDILNRNPNNDFATHRFSFYEFLKQQNGFYKFINK